jgi:AcrR family transcriptional regulator
VPAELPTHPRAERSDKTRNRARVLRAAAELFASKGVDRVTVDEIAARAGVGVGTLYRGFGHKGGLVAAILDERERELQDELLSGPPPLGPGAPAAQRIRAFLDALSRMVENSYELLVVSENSVPGARYRIGSYAAWRLHLEMLLREAAAEVSDATRADVLALDPDVAPDNAAARIEADAGLLADALLAPLAADLYRHQRRELGLSAERIRDAPIRLADGLISRHEA